MSRRSVFSRITTAEGELLLKLAAHFCEACSGCLSMRLSQRWQAKIAHDVQSVYTTRGGGR
eukprot:3454837-Amphidinium_carterae.1